MTADVETALPSFNLIHFVFLFYFQTIYLTGYKNTAEQRTSEPHPKRLTHCSDNNSNIVAPKDLDSSLKEAEISTNWGRKHTFEF